MVSSVSTQANVVRKHYEKVQKKLPEYREKLGRSLTLSEKILFSHLEDDSGCAGIERGRSFVLLRPDRVAMQDATAQMALLQFIQSGRHKVAVPSTVHCDHLIRAHSGSEADLNVAGQENEEVYNFLRSASEKYGIGFWGPGSGIIHQVVLENYAFPGGLMIGTDSHTPNAGGLGMLAIGVGGADAVDVMAGQPWELLYPKIIAVHLKGSMKGWTAPKDVILKVLDILTVKGGTNKIVEYIGEGAASFSCTGKATITNMGAELGATTSVFACDQSMTEYLRGTGREDLAALTEKFRECLVPDPETLQNPGRFYDEVLEIDLDQLEPYIVGPHSPDLARPVSQFAAEITKEAYPDHVSACLIGSCTNSSYEDIYKASSVAKEALKLGLKSKVPFYISPGSAQIFATIRRDGLLETLKEFGGTVLANACGPCIGQWKRDDIKAGEKNAIVTSFNRNFRGRNDANQETLGFISSPEMVVAYALSGKLGFNPATDTVTAADGRQVLLSVPKGPRLPEKGFSEDSSGYHPPSEHGESLQVVVNPSSKRLQLLEPFARWDGEDFDKHLLLVKVKGKCTTDHISPAGQWLRFRGHLDHISDNLLLGACNAFRDKPGHGLNQLSGKEGSLSAVARDYKAAGHRWIVVGDENYGEGSSREHAAMSPRFLNASTVLVRSFARIHETNLKKQGILPLTFADPQDYEKVLEGDKISVLGLKQLAPGKTLTVILYHQDGSEDKIEVRHSCNNEQIAWFRAGSSLNLM
ncbi:MAG: aconitate hydratase [Deltaproteobacteria bacterium]|nr:aconitate hydratase [Deltaproteobacteria bacterium]